MTVNGNRSSSQIFRGPTPADVDMSLSYAPIETVTDPAGQTPRMQKDANVIDVTGATVLTEAQVTVTPIVGVDLTSGIMVNCLNPSVATIDATGRITRVSDGSAAIIARTRWLAKRIDVPISLQLGGTATQFQSWVTGSLAKHCSDAIDNAIAGKSPSGQDLGIYEGAQPNVGLWAAPVNFSAFAEQGNATAISPLHVIYATHWEQHSLTFAGPAGRNIIATSNVGGDITVGKLDSPVTNWAKLLPANHASYLPQIGYSFPVPVVFSNQNRTLQIAELFNASGIIAASTPTVAARKPWYVQPTSGDSGSMIAILINGEMVLISHWTTAGSGPSYADNIAGINAAMTTLGGGYQVTTADLSGYPTF